MTTTSTTTTDTSTIKSTPLYEVTSVTKTKGPSGHTKGDWHQYVIERGSSVVKGMKPGTQRQVAAHAEKMAEDLNSRIGVKGRSLYAPSIKR